MSGFDTLKIERMEQENGSSDVAVVSRSEPNDLCERLLDILVELTHIGISKMYFQKTGIWKAAEYAAFQMPDLRMFKRLKLCSVFHKFHQIYMMDSAALL